MPYSLSLAPEARPNSTYVYSEDDFDGYRAAPLLSVEEDIKEGIIESQDRLAHNLEALVRSEIPHYAKQSAVDFVARSILGRMNQREGLNGIAYAHRKNSLPDVNAVPHVSPEEIADACERMIFGRGSVRQNELACVAFGMSEGELANLTCIGEKRKHLEKPMWAEISDLVNDDATPEFSQMYRFVTHGFDKDITQDVNVSALRFGMKREIGVTEYGATVKGRTTAIFKLYPTFRALGISGAEIRDTITDFQAIEQFRKLPIEEQVKRDEQGEAPFKSIAEHPAFLLAVEWLISTEVEPGLVLARNETVYRTLAS